MSEYQTEQLEALDRVCRCIQDLDPAGIRHLKETCAPYLSFRRRVDQFLSRYFSGTCTARCYESRTSACCTREGIITFFADVAINALFSEPAAVEGLRVALQGAGRPGKCVYLGDGGCLWQVKPIVCEMFLCDPARERVFEAHPAARDVWLALEAERKGFTWPDRPVLFDGLETYFMAAGVISPLMYLHHSPGLLRLKRKARPGKCASP